MLLPSIVESQIRQGVMDYLRTTFPITTPLFSRMLEGFIEEPGRLFKGPFLSLALPFRKGSRGPDYFPRIPLPFAPYLHQEMAFARLSGETPRSTLVATGTGSGKTECFLWPILDYCARRAPSSGIKAILIYPMNALAGDQAHRLARTIWGNPHLKGKVTAGLYVGGEEAQPHTAMGEETILTDREAIRQSPPDLLLTNYKMLDYLLQRPKDKPLWATTDAATLRYLVVDELHTFDGAQGTDLACLIRRLKYRVGLKPGQLCSVGTSATLGSGREDLARLLHYAECIFGEAFDPEAVILEQRQTAREFLSKSYVRYDPMPAREHTEALLGESGPAQVEDYLRRQMQLWFPNEIRLTSFQDADWRLALGARIKELPLFRSMLEILNGRIRSIDEIGAELGQVYREFGEEPKEAPEESRRYRHGLLLSLVAMISAARTREGEALLPFLQVRQAVWMRELRRMVVEVSPDPRLRYAGELNADQRRNHLPVVHCRECGAVGWAGFRRRNRPNSVRADLKEFYARFFTDPLSNEIVFLFPGEKGDFEEGAEEGQFSAVCRCCLELNPAGETVCSECGGETLAVYIPTNRRLTRNNFVVGTKECPACRSREALMLIGAQSASLASVAINQLFASRYNGDKKLLAFSDNVQDAAHRVGFFSARTWRFNLREAIRQYLERCPEEMTLDAFADGWFGYWQGQRGEEDYVATFTPRDLMWMEEFRQLIEREDRTLLPVFSATLAQRIRWEILAEFGFDCRRGRTLEKSGAATLMPVVDWEAATEAICTKLENDHQSLRGQITRELVRRYLLGIVEHARRKGAIFQPLLEAYLDSEGTSYLLNRIPWMPKYGPGMKLPGFFAERRVGQARSQFESWEGPNDWIRRWVFKIFFEYDLFLPQIVREILQSTFRVLEKHGPFVRQESAKNALWGLSPSACRVTGQVAQWRCDRCGHQISLAQAYGETPAGMPCFKSRCRGSYRAEAARRDYYDELYRQGDIVRLYAEEHTGLLGREQREKLEARFKAPEEERRSWYPNLISCTPTLEMGIDIGDLSSVLLCSVPPEQSAFLQRIGRAGRKDGNALTLTIARSMPHDLYFYEDPMEMMDGEVRTPGVHLGAVAVLERQLTAFCLDCWVHENEAIDIPSQIYEVISRLERNRKELFPIHFYDFVQRNRQRLLARFTALFEEHLTEDARGYLASYLEGGEQAPLVLKVHNGILGLRDRREALRKKLETVRRKAEKARTDPAIPPEEKESLAKESAALHRLVRSINEKETLNFFTDEGLIPNYAFPENGILLHSVIYRKKERGAGGEWETRDYEYRRAAANAISELVPGSTFYAGGHHVTIDQIDVTLSQPEEWRFCPQCSHMEQVAAGEARKECPHCGNQGWFDAGQVQTLLKVRQVFANSSERDSLIRDDAEERERRFYVKSFFVDFEPQDVAGAWSVENEEITFGFEFIGKTTFREINFGELTHEEGEGVTIAGSSYSASGFRICRFCGTIQKKKSSGPAHAHFCPVRDKDAEKNFTQVLYLYREFQSESIRFLIPAVTDGVEKKMQSFLAALHLGLREQYQGDVGHLAACIYDEPVPGMPQQRKRYVVLYDTVPGGTGYLKQLTKDKDLIFGVLEKALRFLTDCSCRREPERDGCYRCLLAYRNSSKMEAISRRTAEELFATILKNREQLVRIHSLSGITMNRILESELERKFILALDDRVKKEGGLLSLEMRGNKSWYRLEFGGDGARWLIEPQKEISVPQGLEILCRADFVFHPQGHEGRKMALFTDGFSFHQDRIGSDMRQRMTLLRHPDGYLTWSLTWKDIDQFQNGSAYDADFNLMQKSPTERENYRIFCGKLSGTPATLAAEDRSAMYWLFDYLKNPAEEVWMRSALAHTLCRMTPSDREEPRRTGQMEGVLGMLPKPAAESLVPGSDVVPISVGIGRLQRGHLIGLKALADPPQWPKAIRTVLLLEDRPADQTEEGKENERVWNEFLRLANLYQFLPQSLFLTSKDLALGRFDLFDFNVETPWEGQSVAAAEYPPEWIDVYELISDRDLSPLLDKLRAAGVAAPTVGYELADRANRACALAELAWEERRVAYLLNGEDRDKFEGEGWLIFGKGEDAGLLRALAGNE